MANLETDIRRILKECPNIVIEAKELQMILSGNAQRVIDESNKEDQVFDKVITEQTETTDLDDPGNMLRLMMAAPSEEDNKDVEVDFTEEPGERPDGDIEPDPGDIGDEPEPEVHPEDKPVDPDGLNDK